MTGALEIKYVPGGLDITDLGSDYWTAAWPVPIEKYWSGETAPSSRHSIARLLWSSDFLYCLFDSAVGEPLVVNDKPETASKTLGLWERDVSEIFIAPNAESPRKYFEFEVAPSGEWVDLGIELTQSGRVTDKKYRSNMLTAVEVSNDRTLMAMAIPFDSLGGAPAAGDRWAGNLFRCVGSGPDRGYLAWQPTFTEAPNFHVSERFGTFEFVK